MGDDKSCLRVRIQGVCHLGSTSQGLLLKRGGVAWIRRPFLVQRSSSRFGEIPSVEKLLVHRSLLSWWEASQGLVSDLRQGQGLVASAHTSHSLVSDLIQVASAASAQTFVADLCGTCFLVEGRTRNRICTGFAVEYTCAAPVFWVQGRTTSRSTLRSNRLGFGLWKVALVKVVGCWLQVCSVPKRHKNI